MTKAEGSGAGEMDAAASVSVPVCPCSPSTTSALVATRWPGAEVSLRPTGLRRRADALINWRLRGDVAGAERYGWLSLAALLVKVPVDTVVVIDPYAVDLISHPTIRGDLLGLLEDGRLPGRFTSIAAGDVVIEAVDPTDKFGFMLVRLAATTASTVMISNRSVVTAAVHDSLRRRLVAAGGAVGG